MAETFYKIYCVISALLHSQITNLFLDIQMSPNDHLQLWGNAIISLNKKPNRGMISNPSPTIAIKLRVGYSKVNSAMWPSFKTPLV